jgi:ankyrin repeat protein
MSRLTLEEVFSLYQDLPNYTSIELKDVNQPGIFGERPLDIACTRGKIEEVIVLLNHGANIDATGEKGHTPLHEAVNQGHTKIVKFLLDQGANPHSVNDWGISPLKRAEMHDNKEIITLLTLATKEKNP